MNTNPFEYVLAVVHHGSFSRAAKSIPISQQGLSKSIDSLERDIGIKFFKRTSKKVSLTDEAQELLPYIEELLSSQSNLLSKVTELRHEKTDPDPAITIYATAFFTLGMFEKLDEYLIEENFPKTATFEMSTLQTVDQIIKDPSNSIAVVNIPLNLYDKLPNDGSILFDELFSTALAIMASTKLLSPRKNKLTAKDMKSLPISYPNSAILNGMVGDLINHYHSENIVYHASNMKKIEQSVLAGETAAITDTATAFLNRNEKDRVYFNMDYPVYCNVGFLYSSSPENLNVRRNYMNAIRSYIESMLSPYIKKNPPKH